MLLLMRKLDITLLVNISYRKIANRKFNSTHPQVQHRSISWLKIANFHSEFASQSVEKISF